MVCTESVPSVRCQITKTAARTTAYSSADATYGTWNQTWRTSAAIVPKMPTMTTASQ
jgi:hypothetical protein